MRTYVYIDGFNLYYGAVKNTPYKWLNIEKLCKLLLPKNDIVKLKYFTALVKARPNDPNQPLRQQIYLRALKTIPNLEIVYGSFLAKKVWMKTADSPDHAPQYVQVIKTEEKGSDVNIATHLLNDGHKNLYDVAVLITTDSDLVEPVRIVRLELNKRIGVINPQKRPSRELQKYVDFIRQVRKGVLIECQFPDRIQDKNGTVHKPSKWYS